MTRSGVRSSLAPPNIRKARRKPGLFCCPRTAAGTDKEKARRRDADGPDQVPGGGSELVVHAQQVGTTPLDVFQRTVLRAGIGLVSLVGEVADLEQDAQPTQCMAVGERVAHLRIGDVLADHVAQRTVAVEVADLTDEVRTLALA